MAPPSDDVNLTLPLTVSNRKESQRMSETALTAPLSLPELRIQEQSPEIQFLQDSSEEEKFVPLELKIRREQRENHKKPWKQRPLKGPGTRLTGFEQVLNYYRYKFPMYPQNSRVRQLKKSAYRLKQTSLAPIQSGYQSQSNLSSRKSIASSVKRNSQIGSGLFSNHIQSRKASVCGRNSSQESLIRIQNCYQEDQNSRLNYESSKLLQLAYEAPQENLPNLGRNVPLLQNKFEKLLKRDFRRERKRDSVVLKNMSEVLEEQKKMANQIILTAGVDQPLKLRNLDSNRVKPGPLLPAIVKRQPSPILSRAISNVRSQKSRPPPTSDPTAILEEDESPERMKIPEEWNSALNKKMEVWHDNFKSEVTYEEQFLDRQNNKFSNKLHSSL